MTEADKKRIEKKMKEEFMTVILSYNKISSSIFEIKEMMLERKMDKNDIIEYIMDLLEEVSIEQFEDIKEQQIKQIIRILKYK